MANEAYFNRTWILLTLYPLLFVKETLIIVIISVKNQRFIPILIIFYYLCSQKWQFKIKGMSTSTNAITSDLQAKLDKAREEIHSGQCITLKSHDDIDNYFASLWFIQLLLPRVQKMSSRNGRSPIQSYSKNIAATCCKFWIFYTWRIFIACTYHIQRN